VEVAVRNALSPTAPRAGDEVELVVVELRDRAMVLRGVDDDFLPRKRRVQVRDDANAPPVLAGQDEGVRRGAILAACAERAGLELL
jgi:hypothetical protein